MKVITLLNQKGGVGKTTLSVNIAAGLAIKGYRAVVIDGDAQAHTTHSLRQKECGAFYDLMVREAEWQDLLIKPAPRQWTGRLDAKGHLILLPGNKETRVIPEMVDDAKLLKERLSELDDYVDVVVIDTSPSPSRLHSLIYVASDYILYPTEVEELSLDGLAKSLGTMRSLEKMASDAGIDTPLMLGVQPTMYKARNRADRMGLGMLQEHFRDDVFPPINARTVWTQASMARKSIFSYSPSHIASKQMWGLVERVEQVVR